MTKKELENLIGSLSASLPSRIGGNEENVILAKRLESIVKEDRTVLVELLRDWISLRIPQKKRRPGDGKKEGRMWLALEMTKRYSLDELRPDIEQLLDDVRSGKTYLPYYLEMIEKYR